MFPMKNFSYEEILLYIQSEFSKRSYYIISFFSAAWYLDISITRFAFYVCSASLNIFYYTIDKGFIYIFGPEGWTTFFLFFSKKLASVQCGIISDHILITVLSIFFIFFLVSF